jgi:hypothetical protein
VELKLNGTQELLVCADDGHPLGDSIDTLKRNTETLLDASKEVGLEINIEKTKYMLNGVFWDVTPRGSCKNRRFRGMKRLHHQGDKNR